MFDFLRDLLGIFATVAPFGALPVFLAYRTRDDLPDARSLYLAPPIAFGLLAFAAAVSGPFLDLIDVTAENFQLAAGVLMLPLAARLVLAGSSMPSPQPLDDLTARPWLAPLAFPLLAGPPSIAAAISYAARYGEVRTIVASAVVLALSAALIWAGPLIETRLRTTGVAALGHASGLLLLAVAFEHAIDGIRSI